MRPESSDMARIGMRSLLLLLVVGAFFVVSTRASLLGGNYPDFEAPQRPKVLAGMTCDVTDPPWNAKGDGVADDTAAVARAIAGCGGRSGGRGPGRLAAVVLPKGRTFVTGALNLSSYLVLRVHGTLLASTDPAAYPVVPALAGYGSCRDGHYKAGNEDRRHQAFLSGWNMTQVWVDGGGTGLIDGRAAVDDPVLGSSWVSRFTAKTLDYGRPRLWEPMFSQELALVDVAIRNHAFWGIHPYASRDIYIGGTNITAPRDEGIPNSDGIDPDSCDRVLVENSVADVGDNSVAIKSGMDKAGRSFGRPSSNIVMRDSVFVCETFAIGSEMSGDVFNVTVERCRFGGRGSDFAGLHLKSRRGRGGAVHDLVFKDCDFDLRTSTKQPYAFSASLFYGADDPKAPTNRSATPEMFAVTLSNATIRLPPQATGYAKGLFQFIGLNESKLRDFHFADVRVVSGATSATGDAAWDCTETTGFSFSGNVTPAPGPKCQA